MHASNFVNRVAVQCFRSFLYYKSSFDILRQRYRVASSVCQKYTGEPFTYCKNSNSDPTRRKLWKQTLKAITSLLKIRVENTIKHRPSASDQQ